MTDAKEVNEQVRELTARLVAQGTVIELLLGILLAERGEAAGDITAVIRRIHLNPTDIRMPSDYSAEFLADVLVRSGDAMERIVFRAERWASGPK